MIPFNRPFLTGRETEYIVEAVKSGKISGNGDFTKKCQAWFEQRYGFGKCLLTTSCTDALEMAALLLDIQPGDEVILPSYTFVSTANAFVLRGARLVFADSSAEHPNMDASGLEALITPRTRAIVPVHYAGMACDMDTIMDLAEKHNLFVVEDAAQAIDSYHTGKNGKKALGSIGHLAAFSFHETKNIIAGEGGMLVVNDPQFMQRAEILWEKGTNRAAFWRGEVDKYGWVDVGSSFLPSEVIAAFLYAQLEHLNVIQQRRISLWNRYHEAFQSLEKQERVLLPHVPSCSTNNAHMYYLVLPDAEVREAFISHLKNNQILTVFHYLSLHKSPYYQDKHDGRELPRSDHYSDCLVRLPFYFELTQQDQEKVIEEVVSCKWLEVSEQNAIE
jgi:dTDP-4-amino-4,6-dideoxygalactose transaminase